MSLGVYRQVSCHAAYSSYGPATSVAHSPKVDLLKIASEKFA